MDFELLQRSLLLPPPPREPGVRGGYHIVTASMIRSAFWAQGGMVNPTCLSATYIVTSKDYIHQALRGFHDFLMALTGRPPQKIYTRGVFVCAEFAEAFDTYLALCHLLHWEEGIGRHKLAVGWAINQSAMGNDRIPDDHAITLVLEADGNGGYVIRAMEPQLESFLADYGTPPCRQFGMCLFV